MKRASIYNSVLDAVFGDVYHMINGEPRMKNWKSSPAILKYSAKIIKPTNCSAQAQPPVSECPGGTECCKKCPINFFLMHLTLSIALCTITLTLQSKTHQTCHARTNVRNKRRNQVRGFKIHETCKARIRLQLTTASSHRSYNMCCHARVSNKRACLCFPHGANGATGCLLASCPGLRA